MAWLGRGGVARAGNQEMRPFRTPTERSRTRQDRTDGSRGSRGRGRPEAQRGHGSRRLRGARSPAAGDAPHNAAIFGDPRQDRVRRPGSGVEPGKRHRGRRSRGLAEAGDREDRLTARADDQANLQWHRGGAQRIRALDGGVGPCELRGPGGFRRDRQCGRHERNRPETREDDGRAEPERRAAQVARGHASNAMAATSGTETRAIGSGRCVPSAAPARRSGVDVVKLRHGWPGITNRRPATRPGACGSGP